MDNSSIKHYFRNFENGNVSFNYSCYFENDTMAKIINFLQSLSDKISQLNFSTIKFNCVVNDFEFTHQLIFNFIYADYVENAPDNCEDENDTPFNNCNVEFYYDMRLSFFSSVREYLLNIWNKDFLLFLKQQNTQDNKKPFANYNHEDSDFIIYQELSGDNIDGFICQDTEY
jgi:hypothetical protein